MGFTEGYNAIAEVYDRLNAEIDYGAWADFIEACFDRFLRERPELVLDLACGTGRMTDELARRGYDMIGVDGSEEMLAVAYDRGLSDDDCEDEEALARRPMYLLQDMRRFELYGTVGATVCCLDSLNYLLEDGDLAECFRTVHNYLDPDGLFLFDVNTPYKFKNVYGDNAYILEDTVDGDAVYCGWQNDYDAESGICRFLLSVFREQDGAYLREDEEQRERCYTREQITDTLEACGFEVLGIYSGYAFEMPQEKTERWYFAARKK